MYKVLNILIHTNNEKKIQIVVIMLCVFKKIANKIISR